MENRETRRFNHFHVLAIVAIWGATAWMAPLVAKGDFAFWIIGLFLAFATVASNRVCETAMEQPFVRPLDDDDSEADAEVDEALGSGSFDERSQPRPPAPVEPGRNRSGF